MNINVCICTYKRPELIATLESLENQCLPEDVTVKIIIADNDEVDSARERVEHFALSSRYDIQYVHAPKHNISIARNACLDHVDCNWVAILDDDEVASESWLNDLVSCQKVSKVDVVFGPVIAQYPDTAPGWMQAGDYHSNKPVRRDGVVQTGHTCNMLMRWERNDVREQRFLLDKGRTGGEDTEFFFRLWRMGLKLEICEAALIYEPIQTNRLNFNWIKKRKFRSGQSYAYHSTDLSIISKLKLGVLSVVKVLYCLAMTLVKIANPNKYKFWLLRAYFHAGVMAGVLNLKEGELY